jgi:heme ABC exporter ATP-binding subunit CcmA
VSPAVRCGGLERRFGDRRALAGVDLELDDGEVMLLTGPNGAGKTTLLRILATVLKPTAGTAEVAGHALPKDANAARGAVGYAGHEALVYPALTARENLELYAALHGAPAQAVGDALDRVGLAARATTRVSELSRGMRQRLSLARATLHGPALLLLDEPTTGLDDDGRGVLRTLLAGGGSAVVATHEPEWFAGVADRSVRLEAGRVAG